MPEEKIFYPTRQALLEVLSKGRLTADFMIEPGRNQAIRDFSGLTATDLELGKLEIMQAAMEQKRKELNEGGGVSRRQRFTYEELNYYLDGLASIEPKASGGFMLVYHEKMDKVDFSPNTSIDLTSMTIDQLVDVAGATTGMVHRYLFRQMKPGLEKHLGKASGAERYAAAIEQNLYPPLPILAAFMKTGTLVPKLFVEQDKAYNIIRDFSHMTFTFEQFTKLQTMVPAIKERQVGSGQTLSYKDLNPFMEGIAQVQKNDDGKY